MGQGNPNKVNSIVDQIVEGNNVFKLKSPIEQDKEKDSIAQSINSALSSLNEVGKELVLQDLAVDPDEKFKGFIDNVGNIDVSGLTKFTTTVVKAKIEEAEREGLNLRNGEPIYNSNKVTLIDGVLTLATIDIMINNFKELTSNDRQLLLDNFDKLTRSQQAEIVGGYADRIQEGQEFLNSDSDKEFSDEVSKTLREMQENLIVEKKNRDEFSEQELSQEKYKTQKYIEYVKNNFSEYYNRFLSYLKEQKGIVNIDSMDIFEISDNLEAFHDSDYIKVVAEKVVQEQEQIRNGHQSEFSEELRAQERQAKKIHEVHERIMNSNFREEVETDLNKYKDQNKQKENLEQNERNIYVKIDFEKNNLKEKVSQEIKRLPVVLSKNFSQQDISEAFKNYSELLEQIDEEVIDSIKDKDNNELKRWLKELFEDEEEFPVSENVSNILQMLAQNDFGGNLQQILTNPELLQETFLPALEAEIQKLEQQEKGEKNQEEKQSEEKETLQPQQSSPTFNQESVRDELAAIPVALSNIEGIDRDDIRAGMQGYKQLLDSIDVSSLEGKSNEEVLNILMSRTSNIGLQGNANAILQMISQIGFSENGNKQIASILTESKEAFTALVDEASKEENIDKAIDESKSQQPITDREARPGMQALMVDLKVAKQNENKLGNQVVAKDESLFGTGTSSDSDTSTTSDSSSNKKLTPQNMMSLLIARNTKISDVLEAQEETKEVVKEKDKKEKDGQEQENEEETK